MIDDTYEDVGSYHKEITTKVPEAQKWVDRALIQLYAFNQLESLYCFKKAIEADSNCTFAYWGVSYASGPHYNLMIVSQEQHDTALEYLKLAQDKKSLASQKEQDLIDLLPIRYERILPDPGPDRLDLLKNYSAALKTVYERYPDDLDIAALYAESIMNQKPWQLWNKDGTPEPEALESKAILDKAWEKGYNPFIAHLLVHHLELSPYSKTDAVKIADTLYANTKNVGHLLHMPSHIYIQIGDYNRSVEANSAAMAADLYTVKRIGEKNFTTFYRAHNVHFLLWAAMFKGDYDTAINATHHLRDNIMREEVILTNPEVFEAFNHVIFHVLIRFGKWDDILNYPEETRPEFKITRVFRSYARVLAFAVLGRTDEADKEMLVFQRYRDECNPKRRMGNNEASRVFEVCTSMAEGELAYRKKDYDVAFASLEKAVELCDQLVYMEPWDYMMPPRHALGALLLEQGRFDSSINVYEKDLESYPDNVWSLTGLKECYEKLNQQNKVSEISAKLTELTKDLNVVIKASCFCKLS